MCLYITKYEINSELISTVFKDRCLPLCQIYSLISSVVMVDFRLRLMYIFSSFASLPPDKKWTVYMAIYKSNSIDFLKIYIG